MAVDHNSESESQTGNSGSEDNGSVMKDAGKNNTTTSINGPMTPNSLTGSDRVPTPSKEVRRSDQ